MKRFALLSLVVLIIALVGCSARPGIEPGTQVPRAFDKKVVRDVRYDYLMYLPSDYAASSDRKWPLVIFLHGSGERGSDVKKVALHGPPKLVAAGKQFGFILVSPQCPEGTWWDVSDLQLLLADVLNKYNVDRDRMYLTGLSMGGLGTWSWLLEEPHRFAAAVPICGPSPGHYFARELKAPPTPVWVFHGDKDDTVPLFFSQFMVERWHKAGGDAKLTVYPGVGHAAWTRTYDNPEVWRWLLAHHLPIASTQPTTKATPQAKP